ncbi:hypothetical protein GMAR_ORF144 [Golden Marseillevirus]|uniref:hypothetical protein n=1 Tax=Golden Marseillevirus TaxID=1720526 RepID=UPI000877AE64|nr:hypothetical protein GMAR_ORF144 [Golden Marseillevirus]ALX27518.1 hypothetical protein GMAR_ORF144 [Golden Marseillevirus]
MERAKMEATTMAHVDIPLDRTDVESLSVSLEFAGSKTRKSLFIFFTVEGVDRPWKSKGIEVNLQKRKTHFDGEIFPEVFFDKREGIRPHLCVYILDQNKKHLKSTVKWSLKLEM